MSRAKGLSRRGFLTGIGGLALGGAALTAAGGCGYLQTSDTLSQARDAGFIRMGYADIPPWAFYDHSQEDGLTGAAIAVDRAVFAAIGIPHLRGAATALSDLPTGLKAGHFDAIGGNLAITGRLCTQVAFAEPLFRTEPALMVPAGNPMRLTDYQSAIAAPARVGAIMGSLEAEHLTQLGVVSTGVGTAESGLVALREGRVDALAMDAVALGWLRDHAADFPVEVTDVFSPALDGAPWSGAGATGFRPEDSALLTAYNEQLAALGPDGILAIAAEFGVTERQLPEPWMTTAALCG